MRRDGRRSERNESDPDPIIMRQRSFSSRDNARENTSDCCAVSEHFVVSTDVKMTTKGLPPMSKRKRSIYSLCFSRLVRFVWIGFGLYGFSMLVIYTMSLMSASSSAGGVAFHYTHNLRKTLMMDNTYDSQHAIAPLITPRTTPPLDYGPQEDVSKERDTYQEPVPKDPVAESKNSQEAQSKSVPGREPAAPEPPVIDPVVPEAAAKEPAVLEPAVTEPEAPKAAAPKPAAPQTQEEPETKDTKDKNSQKKKAFVSTKRKKKKKRKSSFKSVPNVLLVGAQKSGTTAVASWIIHHPNVCKPNSVDNGEPIKEVHFFDLEDEMYSKGLDYYKGHFSHCTDANPHIIDATPDYLPHADRVSKTYKEAGAHDDVKIVMILREPVDREFSWYHHMAEEHNTNPNPRPYTERVLDDKGKLLSFEKYVTEAVVPELSSSYGMYSKWVGEWMEHFDRKQILILSYDELSSDPKSLMGRLQRFLLLPVGPDVTPHEIVKLNERAKHRKDFTPSCVSHANLAEAFDPFNRELYKLLNDHPGPDAEQQPFPPFQFKHCRLQSTERIETLRKESKASTTKKKSSKKLKTTTSSSSGPPQTIYFATHHKTGTDLSRSVASLLKEQGLVQFSEEYLNENNLFRNAQGQPMTCSGSEEKPEIRSYIQWPKWMIEVVWSKCLESWWDSWPNDNVGDDALQKCVASEVNTLKKQLKYASCEKNYLVVHFTRNPVDLILSSYRYTKLGKEEWMHNKVSKRSRFKEEYCGKHDCKDMTVQEAIRDLPADVGLQLEMRMISMEITKQMMVASAMAALDPEHHITVSLSDIMDSSERFNKTWNNILQGVFPKKSSDSLNELVQMLKKFDMHADPDNFAGKGHSTVGSTSKEEVEKHKSLVLSDGGVQSMLKDSLLKTLM